MKLPVKIQPPAEQDLEEIFEWTVSQFGQQQAKKYIIALRATIHAIGDFGDQSRQIGGYDNLYSFVFCYRRRKHGHRVFWSKHASEIQIIRIIHTARDWQSMLED